MMALADSAPKLIAEMLNRLAEYGRVQRAPPMGVRKSWLATLLGCRLWLIHSWPTPCTSRWVPKGRLSLSFLLRW
jgi:hypothetical protein